MTTKAKKPAKAATNDDTTPKSHLDALADLYEVMGIPENKRADTSTPAAAIAEIKSLAKEVQVDSDNLKEETYAVFAELGCDPRATAATAAKEKAAKVKSKAAGKWSLVSAAERKKGWRPGGYQVLALHEGSGRMYVAMHEGGAEGSHKSPAKEIWGFDLEIGRAHV